MPRIGNQKSRTGCMRCKNRKVKCDEVRPACGWCTSHSTECEYSTTAGQGPVSSASPTESASEDHDPIPASVPNAADIDRSRLELGLFHYYVYTVARTFPYMDKERGLELHAKLIPQASLRVSNLLNAMYSYALLHIHIQHSVHGALPRNISFFEDFSLSIKHLKTSRHHSGSDVLSLHRDHLDKALQGQRGIVSELNPKNADGICITALPLAQVALVHSSQMRLDHEYSIPSDWFSLQFAFTSCLSASRSLLSMDSATSTLVHSPPNIDNFDLNRHNPEVFRQLLNWKPEGSMEMMDSRTREVYRICITYMETIYRRIAENEPWQALGRRILAFPSVGGSIFLGLLENHQPRALVILAHLLTMAKRLDGSWWIFQNVADYHVRGIAAMLPDEWRWTLDWPISVLEAGAADQCFQFVRGSATATPL